MSAFIAALEGFFQLLSKRSQTLLLASILVVVVWFVITEWNGLNGRVTSLEVRMDKVEARLDKIEMRLDKIESRIVVLEIKVDVLTADVKEMRGDIKTILALLSTKKN
jgi:hypothetical protein